MKKLFGFSLLAFVVFGFSGCGEKGATRTDVEIAKAKTNIVTAYYDFDEYYNSMGKFDKIENMTNVPKEIKVNEEICARFNVKNENEIEIITSKKGNCKDVIKALKDVRVSKGKIIIK